MSGDPLYFQPATALAAQLRAKSFSARELMQAHLAQIARVNPRVNAIVTLLPEEQLLAAADAADAALARGETVGPLHGLPVAHKDLELTKGIRTTFGSPLHHDFVPDRSTLLVERLQGAGAITIGKTNTPEFGAGSQTYNEVFGETKNPYDPATTCGGSSGGAAVALACGMVPIADGSDLGGSLRNPASFCNVVGFRTAPGRVPVYPSTMGWWPFSVVGPMARTVGDVALLLSAIAGPDRRVPISIAESPTGFAAPLDRDFRGVRIAWSPTLGGLPVDRRVIATLEAQRHIFHGLGCTLDEATPDFTDADAIFKGWRAWRTDAAQSAAIAEHGDLIKETIRREAAHGAKLTGPDLSRLEMARTALYDRVTNFMDQHEFLICPVAQVPPYDIRERYVTSIEGIEMSSYIDWMRSCYYITVTGLPAISVPCGFTPEGLPVGIQIVGRHQDEFGVLQLAHAFEQATGLWRQRPAVATQ
jgi:amidase